jgi:hypothetical protein
MPLFPGFSPTEEERAMEQKVEIRPSNIPGAGKGVFAKEFIPNGSYIGYYRGRSAAEKDLKDPTSHIFGSQYVLGPITNKEFQEEPFYVCAKKEGNFTGIINSPRGTAYKTNTRYSLDGKMYTTRDIKAGSELLAAYGSAYWNNPIYKGDTAKQKHSVRNNTRRRARVKN